MKEIHLSHDFACPKRLLTLCGEPISEYPSADVFHTQLANCPDCRAARRADGISCCADCNPTPVPPERTGKRGKRVRYR